MHDHESESERIEFSLSLSRCVRILLMQRRRRPRWRAPWLCHLARTLSFSISENWVHSMAYSSIIYVAVSDWGVNYCSPVHGTHKLSFGFACHCTFIINGHMLKSDRWTESTFLFLISGTNSWDKFIFRCNYTLNDRYKTSPDLVVHIISRLKTKSCYFPPKICSWKCSKSNGIDF